ncbi:transcriptional regulator/antitoxin MazE [Halarcobacter mediterraneus]|uniref:Transcriptional regulator/antitoxin MazE n=1 Tax=Halarcobacter mediterraneus TaxID=2023153 RepID=A0A4Q1B0Q0_9BACT|nr:AbrB/MazE/SpoVT family DNA-binding domain-containing protein [Halarcobacter mediterraneus]RXK14602.1 transcriptional regulator/antitoxin MazE [Halarcobacter mediterraneus]
MTAKISRWGNSQGLRVPKDVMESLQLHIGDNVNITIIDGKAIIEPIRQDIPEFNLNELVSKIPQDYKANEEFDTTIGKEEW